MTQTEKAQATAQRISDVAAERFFENGYEATTIAEVATGANVATGTVLLHFGSKSALATAAFAGQIRELVASAAADTHQQVNHGDLIDIDSQLGSFVRHLYSWYHLHRGVAPAMLREALFATGPWAAYYAETVALTVSELLSIVRNNIEVPAEELPAIGQGLLADYLLVLMQGLRNDTDVTEQVDRFVTLSRTRTRHYPTQ